MLTEQEINKNKNEITALLKNTKRQGIEKLVLWFTESDYFTAPASTMFHGNYKGGLAAHSYKVYEEFKRQAEHYKLNIPEESILIAGVCHDICKVNFYQPNYLKSGNISESKPYVVNDDFPLGHGEKSVSTLQRFISLTNKEAMLIRWHMGPYDPAWNDYQNKIESNFPEVLLFHHVDDEVSKFYKL